MMEQDQGRKALVEMMAYNIYTGEHKLKITMPDAAMLAENLAPLVERIIDARVNAALKEEEVEWPEVKWLP